MGFLQWITTHWLDFLQSIGIVGGLFFSGYNSRKEAHARGIANLIAINSQYRQNWGVLYDRAKHGRVLNTDVDIFKKPISEEESIFVTILILHLGTAYQAMKQGEFISLEGLKNDIKSFFSLPIPKAVWQKSKPLQNRDFANFVESSLK